MNGTSWSIVVVAALLALGGAVWAASNRKSANSSEPTKVAEAHHGGSMTRAQFWQIIANTSRYEADTDLQSDALRKELSGLSVDQIVAFEGVFDHLMKESYSWDLWGAAYVIHGGASDDGFEYFRVWLISKGQAVFEAVSNNPDSLADMIAGDSSGPLEYEDFAYIAREVWSVKTGKDGGEMPQAAGMIYPGTEPKGEPFEEDPSYLAKRYPKLWKRFGDNPAG